MGNRAPLALILLALGGCTCGDDVDTPDSLEPPDQVAEGERDPRVPPGFDLPLPEGATVRYGESDAERATVLVTLDASPEEALAFARTTFESRGWTLRERTWSRSRPPSRWREVLDAIESDESAASARVERGAAGLTRLHLSQRLDTSARPFHAPDEPREWRRVTRPPLPIPPSAPEPGCVAAMRRLCEALAHAGGPAALDCAMDHRNACAHIFNRLLVRRAVLDAEARLSEALRAHDSVGSRGARAETLVQLRVELLLAKANLERGSNVLVDVTDLAALIAATEAEGVVIHADTAGWFARRRTR